MTNKLTDEQETVRSVFGAYINDLKVYSSKPDRPTFRKLEEIRDKAINALEQHPILEKDGTLIVTTEHYENVGRVLVQHGTSGTLFYQDHEPCEEREQGKCPFYAS